MKRILISLTVFATLFLVVDCKSNHYSADKLPPKQIRWGTGGGFVGKEKSNILLENGQIFGQAIGGVVAPNGKVKAKQAKALFKTAESLELAKMAFDHPGNLYYFLELQAGDAVQRVVWGDKAYPVSKSVEDLYAELNGLLKK